MHRWAQAQTMSCFSAKKAGSSITHQLLLMIKAMEKHLIQCCSYPVLKWKTTPCASTFEEFLASAKCIKCSEIVSASVISISHSFTHFHIVMLISTYSNSYQQKIPLPLALSNDQSSPVLAHFTWHQTSSQQVSTHQTICCTFVPFLQNTCFKESSVSRSDTL